jgi:hypothetical protein
MIPGAILILLDSIEGDCFVKAVGTVTFLMFGLEILYPTVRGGGGRGSDVGSLEQQLLKQQKNRHKPAMLLRKRNVKELCYHHIRLRSMKGWGNKKRPRSGGEAIYLKQRPRWAIFNLPNLELLLSVSIWCNGSACMALASRLSEVPSRCGASGEEIQLR